MPCAWTDPDVAGGRRQGRLEPIEIVLAGTNRPGDQFVLRHTERHVGIAVADSVERAVYIVVRHAQEKRSARAWIERPGGDERSAFLEPLEVGAVLFLDGDHVFEGTSVPDEGNRVHESLAWGVETEGELARYACRAEEKAQATTGARFAVVCYVGGCSCRRIQHGRIGYSMQRVAYGRSLSELAR